MSEDPQSPQASKPLQILATTGLVLLLAAAVYAMRHFGLSAQNVSLATTIGTVGTLLILTKRYGTRSVPVLTLMFWVVAAIVALLLTAHG
ncbi:MAG TPA: hypothetical protein DCS82_14035 [Rhodospirillaceae bacterium]|nr:hypothetical protein [Rhodospirillaceae bacterium]HAA92982.1 hypothetical protein [Rhodospirillaceae bacterium]HAT36831.1 hypothetical protein [Rhodospirillaceae bacterium]